MSNPHRIELRKIPIEQQVLDLQIKCHIFEVEIEQLKTRLAALDHEKTPTFSAPKITPYKLPSAKVIKKHIAEEPPIDLSSYTRNMAQRRTRE